MHKINPQIDKVTDRLDVDGEIFGSYWNKETKYVKENIKQSFFHLGKFLLLRLRQRYIGICINYGII